MTENENLQSPSSNVVRAIDCIDVEGSVVRSGLLLADAVLKSLEERGHVSVSFEGLKGASSSYFNVFLRRIEEGCGLAELGARIQVYFGSRIQKLVYDRSFEAISRGTATPQSADSAPEEKSDSVRALRRWFNALGS